MVNCPAEYVNESNCCGHPLAKTELKIGCPVMILRNLDAADMQMTKPRASWSEG